MEALLEKEGNVESWNDERLDELSSRMDEGFKEMRAGFARVDREMKEGFAGVDAKFARIDDRFDKLFLALFTVVGGFAATAIAALIGALFL
jgi:hypothetical protein